MESLIVLNVAAYNHTYHGTLGRTLKIRCEERYREQ